MFFFFFYLRFQSAPICVKSSFSFFADQRWFFSINNANPLRTSTWNTFSEFPPRQSNIPHNNSPLKVRGVPPKAGRCYAVRNEELGKWKLRMRLSALFHLRPSAWTHLFSEFFSRRFTQIFSLRPSAWDVFFLSCWYLFSWFSNHFFNRWSKFFR